VRYSLAFGDVPTKGTKEQRNKNTAKQQSRGLAGSEQAPRNKIQREIATKHFTTSHFFY
jgi:hypothetical protein